MKAIVQTLGQVAGLTAALMFAPVAAQAQTAAAPSASDLTRQLNGAPPSAQRQAPAPVAAAPASTPQAAPAPTARETASRPATASAPQAGALNAAAVAALPFRIDLPAGFQIVEGRSGPDSDIYSVRNGAKTFAMIYAGPSSQYPIYDGQQATVGGRTSVVVDEAGRRTAMEHLFQRETAPREIHVWLMSLDGADLAIAERIGQSVEPR